MNLEFVDLDCPYCGERVQVAVDASAGESQQYIEDCAVCCQPITVRARVDDHGGVEVDGQRGDDSG